MKKKSKRKNNLLMNMKNKDSCECDCCEHNDWNCNKNHKHYTKHVGGGVYCLGFIGAAIYYISNSTSFWGGVVGLLKAIVWPAFLVYDLLKFLGM